MLTICIGNACVGLIDHATAQKWASAIQKKLTFDVAPIWNKSAVLHYIGDSQIEKPQPGNGLITLVDKGGTDGTLGSHWADQATGDPRGEVDVRAAMNDNVQPSQVLDHEGGEMTIDENAADATQVNNEFWCKEINDPVESSDPDYQIDGVLMENFVTPAFFRPGSSGPWDFRKKLTSALQVLPQGYQLKVALGGDWSQITGALARKSKCVAAPGSRRALRITRAGGDPSKLVLVAA